MGRELGDTHAVRAGTLGGKVVTLSAVAFSNKASSFCLSGDDMLPRSQLLVFSRGSAPLPSEHSGGCELKARKL